VTGCSRIYALASRRWKARNTVALRFDRATGKLSPSGAGLYRARDARTGVQDYLSGPELRAPDDVFEHASLASLVGVRVQITHDAGSPTVGYVRGPVRRVLDGEHEFIEAAIEVFDPGARERIARGDLLELSAGYATELDPTPGEYNGRRYVARQRRIQFDHVALLPRDQRARCGEHCRLHFDSTQPRKVYMSDSCPCTRTDVVREEPLFKPIPGTFGEVRTDAAVEARIDALAADARVDAADVRRVLLERTARTPSEREIEDAVFTVRMIKQSRELLGAR
jgi:hypothetical protein